MTDEFLTRPHYPARASLRRSTTVTDLSTRRREEDVLGSITLVFDGVNYGTIPVRAPYVTGKPIVLYLVPSQSVPSRAGDALHGPLDCLITDDIDLALDEAR